MPALGGQPLTPDQQEKRKKRIHERVKKIPPRVVQAMPETAMRLVADAPLRDQQVDNIGQMLEASTAWVDNQNSAMGMPGYLNNARQRALGISDPAMRAESLDFLDAFQAQSPEDQAAIKAYLEGGDYTAQVEQAMNAALGEMGVEVLDNPIGRGPDATELTLAGENASMPTLAGLKAMFPGMAGAISSELYVGQESEQTQLDVSQRLSDGLYQNPGVAMAVEVLNEIQNPNADSNPRQLTGRLVGSLAAAPGMAGMQALAQATRNVPGGETVADAFQPAAAYAGEKITQAVMPAMANGMTPIGHDEHGNPVYSLEDQKEIEARAGWFVFLTGGATFVGGKALSHVGRSVKTVRTVTGGVDAADAALTATRTIAPGAEGGRGGALSYAAETYRLPIRTVQKVLHAGLKNFAKDPEDFFARGITRTTQGQKLIKTLLAAKKKYGGNSPEALDSQVGFVREVYKTSGPGSMNERVIREMLKMPTAEGMQRVFVDTLTNPNAGNIHLRRTNKRLAAVTKKLATLEDPDAVTGLEREMVRLATEMNNLRGQWHAARAAGESGAGVNQMTKDLSAMANRIKAIDADLTSIPRLRLKKKALEWEQKTTFDDSPMMRYPSRNGMRAMVRQPVTKLQKAAHWLLVDSGRLGRSIMLDPAKFVDDLARFPDLHVPGTQGSPSDGLDINTAILSNYMRRSGVKKEVIQNTIGKLSKADTPEKFYQLVEHEIFGEGGLIDQALHPKLDPALRKRILTLHDTAIEGRTMSTISETTPGRYGPIKATRPILGVEKSPGEYIPQPSRDTEFLNKLRLPDIDLITEADSFLRRGLSQLQRAGKVGNAASLTVRLPIFAIRASTLLLKPLVMLVRLPAMGMRIQMEQAMRAGAMGYKAWGGLPDGLSLLPGGIPIPGTNAHILKGLFGEDGWNLLDPDPRMKGTEAPDASDMGMFAEEMMEDEPGSMHPESTLGYRSPSDPQTPGTKQFEGWRNEIEQAHTSRIDRTLAQMALDPERFKAWLKDNEWAMRYMRDQQIPILNRVYPDAATGRPGVVDGTEMEIDARILMNHLEFARRAEVQRDGTMGGRPKEQTDALRESLKDGYDLSKDGPVEVEYNPATGEMLIREKHHRVGLLAQAGKKVPIKVKVVDDFVSVRGRMIHAPGENAPDVDPMLAELSTLGADTDVSVNVIPEGIMPRSSEPFDPVDRWISDRINYLKQLTKDDPSMLDVIARGERRIGRQLERDTFSNGQKVSAAYSLKISHLEDVKGAIRANRLADGDADELIALQMERRRTQESIRDLEAEYPNLDVKTVKLKDKRRFRAHLKEKWEAGEIEMPDRLMIYDRVTSSHRDGGRLDDAERYLGGVSKAMYSPFKALSYVDKKGTRGSVFTQAYKRELAELIARGYRPSRARTIAHVRAAETTKDLMYDLSARTSVQRALRDLMWFAPAAQEVLYTWAVKIPSASYWPVGVFANVMKVSGLVQMLEGVGLIQKDAEGNKIIVLPGGATALNNTLGKITGIKLPDGALTFGELSGLNMVLSSGGPPGLSTPGNFILGKAAIEYGGIFKSISDTFQPYGPEAALLPQPLTYLYESVFGEAPPWEMADSEYLKASWDRTQEAGIQYAYADLTRQGITPPRPGDYGTKQSDGTWELDPEDEARYVADQKIYFDRLFNDGEDLARGIGVVKFLGSTVAPMSLYVTTPEREEWQHFWNEVIAPQGFGSEGMSEDQHQLIDGYLDKMPNSMAFSVYHTGYGPKTRDLPFGESLDDAFYDELLTGERVQLTPEQYMNKLLATESRRFFQARVDKILDEISPGRDPWVLLTHGFEKKGAMRAAQEGYDQWLHLNPHAESLLEDQSAYWVENNNVPVRSFEAERLATTQKYMDQLAPMLNGEEGFRPPEVAYVRAQLAKGYAEEGDFGVPNTPTEKAMDWWMRTVLDPYLEDTTDLYDQAQHLRNSGASASAVYNQIREYANAAPPEYKGKPVPSVEEVFFGNRSPIERQATTVAWASRPLSWLSNFQLDTIGYTKDPAVREYLNNVSLYDEAFYTQLDQSGISTSSALYDDNVAARDRFLYEEAVKIGPAAVEAYGLMEAQPYVRINAFGLAPNSEGWTNSSNAAKYVVDQLEANDLSPKGFGEDATALKVWLYTNITQARAEDKAFDDQLTELSHSFPHPDGGWREGAMFYEALFFGNFSTEHRPPYSVVQAGMEP